MGQTDGQTDGRIAASPNAAYHKAGHNKLSSVTDTLTRIIRPPFTQNYLPFGVTLQNNAAMISH